MFEWVSRVDSWWILDLPGGVSCPANYTHDDLRKTISSPRKRMGELTPLIKRSLQARRDWDIRIDPESLPEPGTPMPWEAPTLGDVDIRLLSPPLDCGPN